MTITNLSKRKYKSFRWGVCWLIFLCFASLIIASCADDSSYEARIEEALMAIDNREYARAIDLLEQLKAEYPGNPLILQYLSNAYAGYAGLDTFNLLTVIDQLNETGDPGSIDMVGTVLGSAGGVITVDKIHENLANLDKAINSLEAIPNPTDDQKVQLGLLSLNHAAMTIAAIVADEQSLTGTQTVQLTEDWLGDKYGGTNPDLSAGWDADREKSLNDDFKKIGEAIKSIENITGAGEENDLDKSFNDFQGSLDDDSDGYISQTDIENYLNKLP